MGSVGATRGEDVVASDGLPAEAEIDRYELIDRIGAGGFGAVYRARHRFTRREVALKILDASFHDDENARERFRREAEVAARIDHASVVHVLDWGIARDGRAFLAMDLVPGGPLSRVIVRDAPLAVERVLDLGRRILAAVSAIHAAGVIHRDLKPSNILLDGDAITIIDFGIHKLCAPADEREPITTTGHVLGSPGYMAPEQVQRTHRVDARTDVYAVGVILFELLTGRRPFPGVGSAEYIAQLVSELPPRLCKLAPHVPAHVGAAIDRALATDPDDRWASAAEFAAALANDVRGDTAASTMRARGPTHRRTRRTPALAAAAVLAALAISGALIFADTEQPRTTAPPTAAQPVQLLNERVGSFELDATSIYWVNNVDRKVGRISKDGSDAQLLASNEMAAGHYPRYLTLDRDHVYWASSRHELRRCAKTGCGNRPTLLLEHGDYNIGGLAVDAEFIYFSNHRDVRRVTLHRIPKNGGEVTDLTSPMLCAPRSSNAADRTNWLSLHAGFLYFACDDDRVGRIPVTGEAMELLSTLPVSTPRFVVANDQIYVGSSQGVFFMPTRGMLEGVGQLVREQANLTSIAVDGDHLYWVMVGPTFENGGGTLARCSLTKLCVTTSVLARNQDYPMEIELDASHVYWSNMGNGWTPNTGIWRLPK